MSQSYLIVTNSHRLERVPTRNGTVYTVNVDIFALLYFRAHTLWMDNRASTQ